MQPGVSVDYVGRNRDRHDSDIGAVYADVNAGTDLVTQSVEGANRQLLVLEDDAPMQHRFRISTDIPAELRLNDEGGVHVIARGVAVEEDLPEEISRLDIDLGALEPGEVELAYIEAPWALDAQGNAVPTSYEVRGMTLVQTVEHQGAAYPVVADPSFSCGFMYCTIWHNRWETRQIANHGWTVALACGGVPFPFNATCALYAGLHWRTFLRHYNAGGCGFFRFYVNVPGFMWSGGHYGSRC